MEKEYVILNLEKEYPGYTGTEKWMIITDLCEEEFAARYPDHYQRWAQSVILSTEMGKEILRYHCNEWKHAKRRKRKEIPLDSIGDSIKQKDRSESTGTNWLYDSLMTLTEIQRRRVILHCAHGFSYSDIAEHEGCSGTAVRLCVRGALKKLRAGSEKGKNSVEDSRNA